jgi:general secretion pathway protein K
MTVRPRDTPERARERGVVLALVLILGLLLSTAIITFSRRAVIDTMIVRNRDAAASAEALARGGLRLATAVLVADKLAANLEAVEGTSSESTAPPGNTLDDLWSQLRSYPLVTPDGSSLQIEIQDAGGRLNLNAVVPYTGDDAPVDDQAKEFLQMVIEKVIDEMPVEPGEKSLYRPDELAENLIDYMDTDDISASGGPEDDLNQEPPYRASNGPLLSVEQLGLVEGFDVQLMTAMRHYVTVHPIVGAAGINLNTAPPHVLALIYHKDVGAGEWRLAKPETVRRILNLRDDGRIICTEAANPYEKCVSLGDDVGIDGSIFPEASLPAESDTFTVTARAAVGDIERTLVAVVDRTEETEPQVLLWRMQ